MKRNHTRTIASVAATSAMLVSVLGMGTGVFAQSAPYYYDISHLTPLARRSIETLGAEGIMNGTAPAKFAPYGVVTRAQAIKFVVKALGLKKIFPSQASFPDISNYSQYYPYAEAALQGGFLNGLWSAGEDLGPSVPISRVDFAVLATNALKDQSLAAQLQNTTKYNYLADISKVPTADRGDVNAMMQVGIIPPIDTHTYGPFSRLNREEFAVAMYRMYNVLKGGQPPATTPVSQTTPATATLAPATASTAVGQADQVQLTVDNASGQVIPTSQLTGYQVTFAVVGPNGSQGVVSPNGNFVATTPGAYTVSVTISGPSLTQPITAQTTVNVYGAASALGVGLQSPTLVADEGATDTVTVKVLDAAGNVVPTFSGPVSLTDTGNATGILNANQSPVRGPVTVDATGGVATFTIQSTNTAVGASDTLTATASANGQTLTSAQASVNTVAQQATSVQVTPASKYLQANTGGNQDAVSAVVLDQAGQPMMTGTYPITFNLTGAAVFANGSTTPIQTAFVANGTTHPNPAQTEIQSIQGDAGTVTVTAQSAGLRSGSATVTAAIAGLPSKLAVSAQSASVTAGSADTLTVTLEDANNIPVDAPAQVSLTGTSSDGTTFQGTIAQGQSTGTLTFKDVKTGAYTVSVGGSYTAANGAAVTLSPGSVSVNVMSGAAGGLSLSPAGPAAGSALDLQYSSQEQIPVTAALVDASGNPVAEAGVPVTFTANPNATGAAASANGVPGGTVTVDTGANGTATANYAFIANPGTVWTVSAQSTGLAAVQQTFRVVSQDATNVQVALKDAQTGGTGEATAGDTIDGTITTMGPNGLAVANGDDVVVTVTPAGGFTENGTGNTALTFPSGTTATLVPGTNNSYLVAVNANGQIPFTATAGLAGTTEVTAKDVSLTNPVTGTASMDVIASSKLGGAALFGPSGQNLAQTPLAVSANTPSAVTLRLTDAEGNPIVSNQTQTVTLNAVTVASNGAPSTTSAGGAFRTSLEGADIPNDQVTVAAGTAQVSLYYVNQNPGSYFLDGTLPSTATATHHVAKR